MTSIFSQARHPLFLVAAVLLLLGLGAAGGWWWAGRQAVTHTEHDAGAKAAPGERRVLYWYDPMVPNARFDKPGKSPFMDMELVPKYADEDQVVGAVRVDPAVTQNLGMRVAVVTRAPLSTEVLATGQIAYNERDVIVLQTRAGGFVERVAALAPGDVVPGGAMLVELRVPEWVAAQRDYLTLRAANEQDLAEAALDRLRAGGMPETLIREFVQSGRLQEHTVIRAPRGGAILDLEVRAGMTLPAGATLARINGIGTVWLEIAVPEAQVSLIRTGQQAQVDLPALPGEPVRGRVAALLPALDAATRTIRVRIELPNSGGRLRPGMSGRARLLAASEDSGLFVPTDAVIRTGRRTLVMLAQEAGQFRATEITAGREIGARTQVLSGLEEGQRVIVSGQFLLDSEASMQGVETDDSEELR